MRIAKYFRADQELILRFLDALGAGSVMLTSSKHARAGFFIFAHAFIREYINEIFFRKEELLVRALEDDGFPPDEGPIGSLRMEQKKGLEAAEQMLNAAKAWHAGDENARAEVGWATSEYTSTLRQHIDRLKNLVFPLLEQNMSSEDEHKITEGLNTIAFEMSAKVDLEKCSKLIESLEEELGDWK